MDVKGKERAFLELVLLEGCLSKEIAIHLQNVYGPAAYYCTSVSRWISKVRRGNEELRNEGCFGTPYRHETDAVIRSVLQEDPNASLSTIAETLSISLKTIHTHMLRISHTLKILRWIIHALTSWLKQIRLLMCLQFFPNSAHTRTIIGGISSRRTKAGFTSSIFDIEHGQQGRKTHLKSKIELLRPEKYTDRFM
jgi:transposase